MPRSVRLLLCVCSAVALSACGGGGGGEPTGSGSPGAGSPGPAVSLNFAVGPPVTAAVAITPAVQVRVQDAQGNTVTSSTTSITLSITSGTGTNGAVLVGTLTRAAVSGVATFNDLMIDKAGTGYTLTATAASLTSATSTPLATTGTLISGLITASTTWGSAGSPYIVNGTVQVASAATITIVPGVEVRYANGALIQVAGNIVANGTPGSTITFTSIPPSPNSNATMFEFLANSNLALSSFSYVTFEKAATAIGVPALATTTLGISNATITAPIVANRLGPIGGSAASAGISISASTISNTAVIARDFHPVRITIATSTLTNVSIVVEQSADKGISILNSNIINGSMALSSAGLLRIEGLATGVVPAIRSTVFGSSITHGTNPVFFSGGSLEITNADLMDVQVNLPNAGGTFTRSSFTYGAAYGTQNQVTIRNGTLINCRISGNGGNTGLVVSASGNFSMTDTDITQNRIGVSVGNGSTGTFSMSNNNLTNNSLYNLEYLRSTNVTLPSNYWGTTDTTTIRSLIYDGNLNILYGIVTFTPFLTAPQIGTGP